MTNRSHAPTVQAVGAFAYLAGARAERHLQDASDAAELIDPQTTRDATFVSDTSPLGCHSGLSMMDLWSPPMKPRFLLLILVCAIFGFQCSTSKDPVQVRRGIALVKSWRLEYTNGRNPSVPVQCP